MPFLCCRISFFSLPRLRGGSVLSTPPQARGALLFPSPACGGGSGRGPVRQVRAVERAPSPTLPRKRGRGKADGCRKIGVDDLSSSQTPRDDEVSRMAENTSCQRCLRRACVRASCRAHEKISYRPPYIIFMQFFMTVTLRRKMAPSRNSPRKDSLGVEFVLAKFAPARSGPARVPGACSASSASRRGRSPTRRAPLMSTPHQTRLPQSSRRPASPRAAVASSRAAPVRSAPTSSRSSSSRALRISAWRSTVFARSARRERCCPDHRFGEIGVCELRGIKDGAVKHRLGEFCPGEVEHGPGLGLVRSLAPARFAPARLAPTSLAS